MIRNTHLYLTIVYFLGVSAIISLLGIISLAAMGREPPASLIAVSSGLMGSLSSFLVSPTIRAVDEANREASRKEAAERGSDQ